MTRRHGRQTGRGRERWAAETDEVKCDTLSGSPGGDGKRQSAARGYSAFMGQTLRIVKTKMREESRGPGIRP